MDCARRRGLKVYIAGGCVRDLLLEYSLADFDFDFVVEGRARILAEACNQELSGKLVEYPAFLTCKISNPARLPSLRSVDFASARSEVYKQPGSLPDVSPVGKIEIDLARRDFSVNAMAVNMESFSAWLAAGHAGSAGLAKLTLDPFGGIADLKNRLIRILHKNSFLDDPTRIFRACRYAARLGFEMESETAGQLREALQHGALGTISAARILNEIRRICGEKHPHDTLLRLSSLGVLRQAGFAAAGKDLEAALERMSSLPALKSADLAFECVLAVCFACLPEAQRSEMILRYRLGRKREGQFQRILQSICGAVAAAAGETSDSALLAGLCLKDSSELRRACQAEALRRHLFREEMPE